MKIDTQDLIGPALDWAVAQCENAAWVEYDKTLEAGLPPPPRPSEFLRDYCFSPSLFKPSTDWAQGGPIIERELIDVATKWRNAGYGSPTGGWVWEATTPDENDKQVWVEGPTPLIAVTRCYVASKLGDEVDVPEELA